MSVPTEDSSSTQSGPRRTSLHRTDNSLAAVAQMRGDILHEETKENLTYISHRLQKMDPAHPLYKPTKRRLEHFLRVLEQIAKLLEDGGYRS